MNARLMISAAAVLLAAASGGCQQHQKMDMVPLDGTESIDGSLVRADRLAIKQLAEFAESGRVPAGAPAPKLAFYSRFGTLMMHEDRPVFRVYYLRDRGGAPSHPPQFTVWVYLDDGTTRFFAF